MKYLFIKFLNAGTSEWKKRHKNQDFKMTLMGVVNFDQRQRTLI